MREVARNKKTDEARTSEQGSRPLQNSCPSRQIQPGALQSSKSVGPQGKKLLLVAVLVFNLFLRPRFVARQKFAENTRLRLRRTKMTRQWVSRTKMTRLSHCRFIQGFSKI